MSDTQIRGNMKSTDLHGSWSLLSFDIEKDGFKEPWGKNTKGLLIYSPDGHMSVSINKAIENDPTQNEEQNSLDSLLFYSGTYRLEGETIWHQVQNASNPARIGKEMVRHAVFEGGVLTLSTPVESFGRAILVWKRV